MGLKQVKTAAGTQAADRIRLELWIAAGYETIELEAFAYPCLCRPAAGALPAQEQHVPVGFTPSKALAAALFAEAKAAVDSALEGV